MSTIVQQQHNLQLSSQSTTPQQRPSHIPSKNLSQDEIQCLYDLLGNNYVTLATAVAQILYGCNNVWKKQACGVLCFVKDYSRRAYYFRLYNLRSKELILEEITSISLSLEKSLDCFYTFDGMKCKVGINFVDHIEAETFCKNFHDKQQDRQKKMNDHKSAKTHPTSISAMVNTIKLPSNDVLRTPVVNKKPKSKTVGYRKGKHNRPVISEPDRLSLVHVMHVGHEQSFVIDETQKQLFEQVLTRMHMSPEEELYIRRIVKNTDHGLEKLLTKSTHDINIQEQDRPPDLPPRTYPPLQRNNKDTSRQSLTSENRPQFYNTSTDSEQLIAPVVPPRPPRRISNNTQQSIKTPRPPPPPIPTESQNQMQNSCMPPPPPPPPLPPPAPMFVSEQTTTGSSTQSSNSAHNSLLKEICNFDSVRLKPASQRPTSVTKPPEDKSGLDAKQTMEENIRAMLEKRRQDLMGRDDKDDSSDSSDDEFD